MFSNTSLQITAGPGLIFETLPVAFYSLPLGNIFSVIFILISIAALSSSISLLEPFTAWIEEKGKLNRFLIVVYLGIVIWFLGLGSIFSFNIWSDLKITRAKFFRIIRLCYKQYHASSGWILFVTVLIGWVMPMIS